MVSAGMLDRFGKVQAYYDSPEGQVLVKQANDLFYAMQKLSNLFSHYSPRYAGADAGIVNQARFDWQTKYSQWRVIYQTLFNHGVTTYLNALALITRPEFKLNAPSAPNDDATKLDNSFRILFGQLNLLINKAEIVLSNIRSGNFANETIPGQSNDQLGGVETRTLDQIMRAQLNGIIAIDIPNSVTNINHLFDIATKLKIPEVENSQKFSDLKKRVSSITTRAGATLDNNASLQAIEKIVVLGAGQ